MEMTEFMTRSHQQQSDWRTCGGGMRAGTMSPNVGCLAELMRQVRTPCRCVEQGATGRGRGRGRVRPALLVHVFRSAVLASSSKTLKARFVFQHPPPKKA